MKVALCISGQPRFYLEGFQYIYESILKPLDPDVFIHTWHDPVAIGKVLVGSHWTNDANADVVQDEVASDLTRLYEPVRMLIENPNKIQFPTGEQYTNRAQQSSTYPMFYSIGSANGLKTMHEQQMQFEYDWVIRCRFDLKLPEILDLKKYNNTTLYAPDHLKGRHDAFPDMFGFSSSYNMNVYSSVFNFIDFYCSQGHRFANEDLLMTHLKSHKVSFEQIDYKCEYIRSRN